MVAKYAPATFQEAAPPRSTSCTMSPNITGFLRLGPVPAFLSSFAVDISPHALAAWSRFSEPIASGHCVAVIEFALLFSCGWTPALSIVLQLGIVDLARFLPIQHLSHGCISAFEAPVCIYLHRPEHCWTN